MKKFLRDYGEDILLLMGCVCILVGLSMWSIIITWIAMGIMLIGMAVLIGKAKGNATD